MSKYDIKLASSNKGALLTEVARAYLHGAGCSALLGRLIVAMEQFKDECSKEDAEMATSFQAQLEALRDNVRKEEDRLWSS